MLAQSLLALAGMGLLAWIALRYGAGALMRRSHGNTWIEVIERIPLDNRRCLYVVRYGERALLLGAGDGAAPHVLAEFSASELPQAPQKPYTRFDALLGRKEAPGAAPRGRSSAKETM